MFLRTSFAPCMQPATKGMVNGIGQALAALGRSIGPALGAPVFAWSESTGERAVHSIGRLAASILLSQFLLMIVYNYNHTILCITYNVYMYNDHLCQQLFLPSLCSGLGWPLNFHFVFDLMVVSSVGIILLSFFLPKSIENKRKTPPIVSAKRGNTEEPDSDLLPANVTVSSDGPCLTPANISITPPPQDMKLSNSELPIQTIGSSSERMCS